MVFSPESKINFLAHQPLAGKLKKNIYILGKKCFSPAINCTRTSSDCSCIIQAPPLAKMETFLMTKWSPCKKARRFRAQNQCLGIAFLNVKKPNYYYNFFFINLSSCLPYDVFRLHLFLYCLIIWILQWLLQQIAETQSAHLSISGGSSWPDPTACLFPLSLF